MEESIFNLSKNAFKMLRLNKSLKILISLIITLGSTISAAGYSVQAYKENKSNDLMKMYIYGLGNGYLYSNVYMRGTSIGPIFCPNPDAGFKISEMKLDNFITILDFEILQKKPNNNTDIETILLQGMMNFLSCK